MEENILITVLDTVARLFNQRGWRLFSPRHLVEMEGIVDIEDIDYACNAFSVLTLMGYFTAELEVIDVDGIVIYGGDAAKFDPKKTMEEFRDMDVEFNECSISVSYRMTDKLENEIVNCGGPELCLSNEAL